MSNVLSMGALRRAGLILVLFALAIGCAKKATEGTVAGKLTLDGKAFANAKLNFISKETGSAATADPQDNGSFSVGAPMKAGTYTVFLVPKEMATPDNPKAGSGPDKSVPQKYWSESTSDLKVSIKEGKNDLAIDLKK